MPGLTAETPIVIFGDDWQRQVSTLQHLFNHIVGRRRVIWVNSFGHRAPRLTVYDLRRATAKVRRMLRTAVPETSDDGPARVIEPRALPWHNLSLVRMWNTWSLRRDIRRALRAVAPGQRPVLITGTPAALGVVGALDERAAVYFAMDDYGELPGVDAGLLAPLERQLLDRVDAVIATAAALVELKRPKSGNAFQLPQGVNYERFSTPMAVPADFADVPRPIIGFAGGISSACDFDVVAALADAFPSGTIALIGPLQAGIQVPQRANIRLFGPRSYGLLPAYVQAFDVGIIPYVLNDWTRSVDPLKLLEYLAAGIPVVSTDLPEVHKYEGSLRIASGAERFVAAVRAALTDARDPAAIQARQAVAKANTWAVRAERLLAILDSISQS